ncbi:hypothetical protein R6Q59_036289 [Mikania micrantha]
MGLRREWGNGLSSRWTSKVQRYSLHRRVPPSALLHHRRSFHRLSSPPAALPPPSAFPSPALPPPLPPTLHRPSSTPTIDATTIDTTSHDYLEDHFSFFDPCDIQVLAVAELGKCSGAERYRRKDEYPEEESQFSATTFKLFELIDYAL